MARHGPFRPTVVSGRGREVSVSASDKARPSLAPREYPATKGNSGSSGDPVGAEQVSAEDERYLCAGLIRLHVLHHAVQAPVFGLEMIEELAQHGYKLSAGTLYPILHGLQERGLLASEEERVGRSRRRVYRATAAGRAALAGVAQKVCELFAELDLGTIVEGIE